jgi:hypothetical protein
MLCQSGGFCSSWAARVYWVWAAKLERSAGVQLCPELEPKATSSMCQMITCRLFLSAYEQALIETW